VRAGATTCSSFRRERIHDIEYVARNVPGLTGEYRVVVYTESHPDPIRREVERSGDFQGADDDVADEVKETRLRADWACAAPSEGAGRGAPCPALPTGQAPAGICAVQRSNIRLRGEEYLGDRSALARRGWARSIHGCRLLGAAALCDRKFALAFPSFGPEGRVRRSWPSPH